VVVLAQDEARALRHNFIGTEHLLLGLIREDDGLGARVLAQLGVELEAARSRVRTIVGEGDEVATGQIPFTPRAKKVLELALREGLSLGHNYIGTEHILLGLARQDDGVAAEILRELGVGGERVRNEVIRTLGGTPSEYRAVALPRGRSGARVPQYVVGWALGAATLAAGILIGWAIWG
jgi:ATP-dependent Clp protease ATP-binding subunit ClpC